MPESDPLAYCTQSDLEFGLGGADALAELADWDGDGVADASVVQDFIYSGAAEMRPYIEVKHDPETIANLDDGSLRRLRDANVALSSRIAWEKGSKGQATPEPIEKRAERTETFLSDLAAGKQRLGRVSGGSQAALGQPVGVVDFDPHGHRMSIHGLKRGGFR
jgi:hypothetical protein